MTETLQPAPQSLWPLCLVSCNLQDCTRNHQALLGSAWGVHTRLAHFTTIGVPNHNAKELRIMQRRTTIHGSLTPRANCRKMGFPAEKCRSPTERCGFQRGTWQDTAGNCRRFQGSRINNASQLSQDHMRHDRSINPSKMNGMSA